MSWIVFVGLRVSYNGQATRIIVKTDGTAENDFADPPRYDTDDCHCASKPVDGEHEERVIARRDEFSGHDFEFSDIRNMNVLRFGDFDLVERVVVENGAECLPFDDLERTQ